MSHILETPASTGYNAAMPQASIYLDDRARQQLALARKQKGITLKTLAELCECSWIMVQSVEKGKKRPSESLLNKICAALDLEWAEQSAAIYPRQKGTAKKKTGRGK